MFAPYLESSESVLTHFYSNTSKGLNDKQVEKARTSFGLNELEAKKKISPFIMFLNQFKSFIIYILLFAVVLSFIEKEYVDAIVILIILFMNAIIGFVQEFKAEKAIDSLKQLSGLQVTVIRNGKEQKIPTKDLVPGDIVLVEEGNKIPADCRIIESRGIQISESSLTGESVPVSKHANLIASKVALAERKNMLYSGTLVQKGKATAVVVATGMQTEIGRIATMINEVEDKLTPLQKKLNDLGQKIGIATLVICFVILLTGIFSEGLISMLVDGNYKDFVAGASVWLLLAVALAVAAVPEGLPAIVTIALSIGVKKMVHRNVLIRHLPSVETLGETTVICSDKTGTLTKNEMTVRKLFTNDEVYDVTGSGYEITGRIEQNGKPAKIDALLFRIGALCNNAKLHLGKKVSITGDPTEAALLVSAKKAKVDINGFTLLDEDPFDSVRKMMSTVYKDKKGKKVVYVKGAPEMLLKNCSKISLNGKVVSLTAAAKKKILKQNDEFASSALRVLGFAYKPKDKKDDEKDLIFVGLQGMIDPPRDEVKGAVQTCKEAGIRVIMITGDNLETAKAVAGEIGITGDALSGTDFGSLTKKQQSKIIQTTSIFARVEPAHKMRIVELLQKQGHIVAMTGDGVNDAPAIKKADLGIAMGKVGTDVAKESSEMILLDDNFTSIVSAVEEGRGIFTNIKKFVNYLLSCNLGEVFIIFFAVIFFGVDALPLTAIMLLWLNLVTDGLPALALSVDPNPTNLMKQKPTKGHHAIMGKSMMFSIVYVSLLITAGVLFLFKNGLQSGSSIAHVQSLAFTAIIMFELIRLHTVRSEHKLGAFSNVWLILAVGFSLFLQFIVLYTPLSSFFGTVPLGIMDWVSVMIVGVLIYALTAFTTPLARLFGIKN